jgi:hypothetical protein
MNILVMKMGTWRLKGHTPVSLRLLNPEVGNADASASRSTKMLWRKLMDSIILIDARRRTVDRVYGKFL